MGGINGCVKVSVQAIDRNWAIPEPRFRERDSKCIEEPVANAKERARRTLCKNNLRQLAIAAHLYAADNRERLFGGAQDSGDYYLLMLSSPMFLQISDQYGDRILDCPNIYPRTAPGYTDEPRGRLQSGWGYYLGYHYHGGKEFAVDFGWISPRMVNDEPTQVIFSESNSWCELGCDFWLMAPHTSRGAVRLNGIAWVSPTSGESPVERSAQGGNVGTLDGAVTWQPISELSRQRTWSYLPQFYGLW